MTFCLLLVMTTVFGCGCYLKEVSSLYVDDGDGDDQLMTAHTDIVTGGYITPSGKVSYMYIISYSYW